MQCIASARLTGAPVARSSAKRSVRRAAVRPVAVAAPTPDYVNEKVAEIVNTLETKATTTAKWAQAKWELSDNKPTIVATCAGAFFALYLTSGLLNTIDHLPLFNRLFELMGMGVSGWFGYRWFFVAGEKEVIQKQVSSIAVKVGLDL